MPGENLTRIEAQERRAIVDTQAYEITLDLRRGAEVFGSRSLVRFTATPGASTFIDLIAREVRSITLNGREIPTSAFADSRIALDGLETENELVVDADCEYTNTGEGLHRFVDPVDGEVYLYTQFEVPDSRRVFAVFEQPDLKATFQFTVTADDAWAVVSNSPTPEPQRHGDGAATWTFEPTPRISSYITALVAGPYASTFSELTSADGRVIPLGVYARKTAASTASHDELKASIRAHGVMQNLSAYDGKDGFFYVYAGGRRLTALQDLATEGAIEADAKIGCVVKDAKDAAELSLVENVMRAAMHPADEFEAFAALIEQGKTEDEVALRFGVTVLHVRKRMKLAAVAPQILALYREGRITHEALMAFTLSDSHERQMEVWTKAEPQATGWNASQFPNTVKRLMNETRVSATSKLARFVGLERYVEAGGPITQDLFSSNDETFLDDVALLHELASQRLEEAALPLRALWKWVETAHEMSYETKDRMGRIYAEAAELPDEVAEEFDGLTDRINAFENADDLTEEEHAELAALEERYAEIEAMAQPVYTPDLMALAGVFVTIGHHGDLMIEAGMVRREDMPALVALSKEKEAAATAEREAVRLAAIEVVAAATGDGSANVDHDAEASEDQGENEVIAPVLAVTQPAVRFTAPRNFKPAREEDETEAGPSMSAALVADLQAIRHQVFQAHLASDFEVAFDLMLFSICQSAFSSGYSRKPIDISITQAQTHNSAAHRAGTVSEKILQALKANLRLEWMTLPVAEQFGAMCALSTPEKQALFAFAAAHGVQQQLSTDSHAIQAIEAAGARMEIAVDQNWRPTAANYFVRVKKDMLLETARETVDHQWAHDHSGGKKADFAKTMELAFSAEGRQRLGIPADAVARTAAWLPAGMAFGGKVDAPLGSAEAPIAPESSEVAASDEEMDDASVVALPAFLMGDDGDENDVAIAQDFMGDGYDPASDHFAVAAE